MSTAEQTRTAMGSVVLYDVSWQQYNGLVDAMAEHRFRHTYRLGTMEIFGEAINGSAATRPGGWTPPKTKDDERAIVLHDIAPDQYRGILDAMGNRRFRHSYNHRTMEIMSPSFVHEWENRFLQTLLPFVAVELGIEIKSLGSWTMRPEDDAVGIEPDSCFYIANEPAVRFKDQLDLQYDPPPDLAIEIDVTNSSVKRLAIYKALRVPEVWRYDGKAMRFLKLTPTGYAEAERSVAFPFLPPSKLEELLDARTEKTELQLIKEFVAWLRENAL